MSKLNPLQPLAVGPRVLLLDIETAPTTASVWGLWKNNVGLNQIEADWYVLAWCAKWLDEKPVFYEDQSDRKPGKMENDRAILLKLWKLLDEADLVIAHNGRKFDLPKLNARFVIHGMKPPSPYRIIDTLDICKKHFRFTSNKLEYISGVLAPQQKKSKHHLFPGFELWKECLAGNPKAWKEMRTYNIQDVRALEAVYVALRPYHDTHPNVGLFFEDDKPRCKCCGSEKVVAHGWRHTNVSRYMRWKCKDCGGFSRSGQTQVPLAVRRQMLR